MQDTPRKGAALEGFQSVWVRRKWLAIVVFALPFSAALSLVLSLPSTYRSTATVLVDQQQVPEAFVRPTVTSALEIRLRTISQELLSRSRLEELIHRFGLYPQLRRRVPTETLVERMRGDIVLELRRSKETDEPRAATVAFAISYRGSEPQTVAQVTNTLASLYIEENLKVRERQATGTSQFLRAQLETTKKELDEQERVLSGYKQRYLGELPQQMATNLTALEQLGTQLRLNSDNQIRVSWRRDSLESQLADAEKSNAQRTSLERLLAEAGAKDETKAPLSPDAGAARLTHLEQQLTELQTRYTDKHPDVIRLKAEIVAVERRMMERPEGAGEAKSADRPLVLRPAPADPAIARLKQNLSEADAEMQALKNEETRLHSTITEYRRRVENTPRREQEFQELSRGYETTKEHYQSLLKRYEEAQLAEDMEQRQKGEQFRLLDPAIAATEPSAPNRLRLLLMSLALSLGLAVGAVVLAEQVDTSFHSVDELQAFTEVPVLLSIPRIVRGSDTRAQRRRVRLVAAAAVVGLVILVGSAHVVARGNERLVWILPHGHP